MLSFISDIYAEYLFLELYASIYTDEQRRLSRSSTILHTQPRRRGHGGGCALYTSYTSLK